MSTCFNLEMYHFLDSWSRSLIFYIWFCYTTTKHCFSIENHCCGLTSLSWAVCTFYKWAMSTRTWQKKLTFKAHWSDSLQSEFLSISPPITNKMYIVVSQQRIKLALGKDGLYCEMYACLQVIITSWTNTAIFSYILPYRAYTPQDTGVSQVRHANLSTW